MSKALGSANRHLLKLRLDPRKVNHVLDIKRSKKDHLQAYKKLALAGLSPDSYDIHLVRGAASIC